MPIHPFDPSESDDKQEETPDIGDVVDRILNGGDDPVPTATGI